MCVVLFVAFVFVKISSSCKILANFAICLGDWIYYMQIGITGSYDVLCPFEFSPDLIFLLTSELRSCWKPVTLLAIALGHYRSEYKELWSVLEGLFPLCGQIGHHGKTWVRSVIITWLKLWTLTMMVQDGRGVNTSDHKVEAWTSYQNDFKVHPRLLGKFY